MPPKRPRAPAAPPPRGGGAPPALTLLLAFVILILAALLGAPASLLRATSAPLTAQSPSPPRRHFLRATTDTVAWGFYSRARAPALRIASGDVVEVELLTHHAGDFSDGLLDGDLEASEVFSWARAGLRGASGRGDGPHLLTGPIYIDGAQPGDVVTVEILSVKPRRKTPSKKAFGVSIAGWWGFSFGLNGPDTPGTGFGGAASERGYVSGPQNGGIETCPGCKGRPYQRETVTVYEINVEATGEAVEAVPLFSFIFGQNNSVVTSPCLKHEVFKLGVAVPCVGNSQTWRGFQYPGLITDHTKTTKTFLSGAKWSIPAAMHIGSVGLAPAAPVIVESIPPMRTGGNIDDKRLGPGAKIHLPVEVEGGLLSLGDAHAAMGHGEVGGTGIEAHADAVIRVTLVKRSPSMPALLSSLSGPILETPSEIVVHGFTFTDYLTELGYTNMGCDGSDVPGGNTSFRPTGCPGTATVYSLSAAEPAVANALRVATGVLASTGLDEDAAVALMSTAADFGFSQLANGNWGATVSIPKAALPGGLPAASPLLGLGPSASHENNSPRNDDGFDHYVGPIDHNLPATVDTVTWGVYSRDIAPRLTTHMAVEMLADTAGDWPEGMIFGDPNVESIFLASPPLPRGISGAGDGVHILTGPIYVAGASPGDTLAITILSLSPRKNPGNSNRSFGVNAAAWWGYHYGLTGPLARSKGMSSFPDAKKREIGYSSGDPNREISTVFELNQFSAVPVLRYRVGAPGSLNVSPCLRSLDGNVLADFPPGISVPCANDTQFFSGYQFPGLVASFPDSSVLDFSIANSFSVPLNFHIGSIGTAPAAPSRVSSVQPFPSGGNFDSKRVCVGSTIFLKVNVPGGLLSLGDAHAAMGDGELSGTGIEAHVNAVLKIVLIKHGDVPPPPPPAPVPLTSASSRGGAASGAVRLPPSVLDSLRYPLIENADAFVVHGFSLPDHLASLGHTNESCDGTSLASVGGTRTWHPAGCAAADAAAFARIDDAVSNTFLNAKAFIMAFGLSEDEAHAVLSTAVDFGVTQLVDGNIGCHAIIPKAIFRGNGGAGAATE